MAATGIVANPGDENGVLLVKTTATPATPAAGNLKIFVDSADDETKQVDSTGTVTSLAGGGSSPTTTRGDIIRRGASADERLALGAANALVMSDGTDTIFRTPPRDSYTLNEGSDYTTSSTSFVDVDGTNLALTITTNGGDVLVGFAGYSSLSANFTGWNVAVDGADYFADEGLARSPSQPQSVQAMPSFVVRITGLSAASHTFKLRWRQGISGTSTLYAGAGTSNSDVHPQFWVLET